MENRSSNLVPNAGSASPHCPQCDGPVNTVVHQHVLQYGSGDSTIELNVNLPVRKCPACSFEFLDEEGESVKHEALCRHFGVLGPNEIRDIRRAYDLTRAQFAELTGLGEATLGRWENGTVIQTQANDRYLRLLAQPATFARLGAIVTSLSGDYLGNFSEKPKAVEVRFPALRVTERLTRQQSAFRLRAA